MLWNVLQSHPLLCSPILETGALFTEEIAPFSWLPPARAKQLASSGLVQSLGARYVGRKLDSCKLRNFESPDNGSKCEGVAYTSKEVRDSIICLKGVGSDIDLNPLLRKVYGRVAFVPLVRDGYAVCDGWMRRGMSASAAGKRYASCVRRILQLQDAPDSCPLVRFEELVVDPFGIAERIFGWLNLEPTQLPKLRLKAKRVLGGSGSHEPTFGVEGQKEWFDPIEIGTVLRPGIDAVQRDKLEREALADFERHAGPALAELGYL